MDIMRYIFSRAYRKHRWAARHLAFYRVYRQIAPTVLFLAGVFAVFDQAIKKQGKKNG